jgi:cyclopropane fatty-acyl-phospholipid synthase-like methyltransferase
MSDLRVGPEGLKAHYGELYRRYGASHQAVQWSSRETQERRFDVLCDVIGAGDSLIDLGCGLGDLLGYLRQSRGFYGRYLGLDFVPEFVQHARQSYRSDGAASFAELDISKDALPGGYDVIVTSGMFNNRIDDNWSFLLQTVQRMFGAAKKAAAFNAMSSYVDYEDPALFYCDPLRLFDQLKRQVSPLLTLRHDYRVKPESVPFEFSVYLFK